MNNLMDKQGNGEAESLKDSLCAWLSTVDDQIRCEIQMPKEITQNDFDLVFNKEVIQRWLNGEMLDDIHVRLYMRYHNNSTMIFTINYVALTFFFVFVYKITGIFLTSINQPFTSFWIPNSLQNNFQGFKRSKLKLSLRFSMTQLEPEAVFGQFPTMKGIYS